MVFTTFQKIFLASTALVLLAQVYIIYILMTQEQTSTVIERKAAVCRCLCKPDKSFQSKTLKGINSIKDVVQRWDDQ